MLAEWFLVTQITKTPGLARGMANLGSAQKAALLALLAHVSDHMPGATRLFAEFVATDITGVAAAAVVAALAARAAQPSLDVALAPLISQASWTDETLNALDGQLPEGLLSRVRAAVAAALVENLREANAPESLAAALEKLGLDLGELGRYQEALAVDEEALGLWRSLAEHSPAHQPGLARTLQILGLDLGELGRYQEALAVTEEALGLWRSLAEHSPAHQPGLARTLQILGLHLGELGRRQEALAVDEEALGLWRSLAEHSPAHQPGLARTLQILGGHLSEHEGALAVTEEALGLWRSLAEHSPAHSRASPGRCKSSEST